MKGSENVKVKVNAYGSLRLQPDSATGTRVPYIFIFIHHYGI